MTTWLLVFAASFIIAIAWVGYVKGVKSDSPARAAAWDAVLVGVSGLLTYGVVHDLWLLIPNVLAAIIGTYVGMVRAQTPLASPHTGPR